MLSSGLKRYFTQSDRLDQSQAPKTERSNSLLDDVGDFVDLLDLDRCKMGQLEKTYIINKYSIHFQLFNNATRSELDKALADAKNMGISLVVQLVENWDGSPRLKKARARFHFTKPSELGKVLQQLYYGKIDLLLNVLQTKEHYNFVRAFWQQHRPYCILLPRKLERMHLEVLLHPFEWRIWAVFVGMLVLMQLVNLIFPAKFNYNLIMICFFGSGPPEHVLPSSARLMVCSVCIILFLLTETYQAILLSLIAADSYMKNPETVDEFLNMNMTLYAIKVSALMLPPELLSVTTAVPKSLTIYSMLIHATVQACSDALFWNTNPLKLNLPTRGIVMYTVTQERM
uniref:Uncharacterized protein n=1 Tax=Anopheles culicifacies TaxID=139723 RepID=A0A182MPH2_9DIPT